MKLLIFLFLLSLRLQAQVVDGITDRGVYIDSVTFTVRVVDGVRYDVKLNDKPIPAGVPQTVTVMDYYELVVGQTRLSDGATSTETVRFIIVSSRRGSPELGLIEWTPYPPIPSAREEFDGAELTLIAPKNFPIGLQIPVIGWIDDGPGNARRVNGTVAARGLVLPLRRGVGHAFLEPGAAGATIHLQAQIHTVREEKSIKVDDARLWSLVSGTLPPNVIWPENSRIRVTRDLTIAAGNTLTIGAGAIVTLAAGVNITNSGRTIINGTKDAPVVFTALETVRPEQHAGAWGGFLLRGTGAELVANYAIMTGSGAAANFSFSPGASHRREQALLLVHSGAKAVLTNCFLINNAGQIGNGYNSDITFDHCLVQRAITAGEYEGGTVMINNSAVIEFPSIDGVYNPAIVEADYDALYFTTGTHIVRDSLIGFAKDDAIDAGSGGAGTVLLTNCWIESALHEALAWSGAGRETWTYDTVLINNGQGIECGWSSSANSPFCLAERVLCVANGIGARYGDNYQGVTGLGLKAGFLSVANSILLHNYRDVFGRPWDSTWDWRTNNMSISSNYFTTANTFHPQNAVWDTETDAPRLLPFVRTPPGARVGIGFANWDSPAPDSLTSGVPIRLSTFTTNQVQVDYSVETQNRTLASGTLQFSPGETLKVITSAAPEHEVVRINLHSPVGAEITTSPQLISAPPGDPRRLGLTHFGSEHVLYWEDATFHLEATMDLGGPWVRVPNDARPFTLPLDAQQRFYRLIQPQTSAGDSSGNVNKRDKGND